MKIYKFFFSFSTKFECIWNVSRQKYKVMAMYVLEKKFLFSTFTHFNYTSDVRYEM